MAKTRDYMDYLDEKIEIAPANSQEEYQAASTIADLMRDHGLEPQIEEFETYSWGKLLPAVVVIVMFVCLIITGVTEGVPHIVMLLLSLLTVALLLVSHYVSNIFEKLGPSKRSQNVIAMHRASGDKVVKGARPIVIVTHYDTPRASLMRKGALARVQAPLWSASIVCAIIIAVSIVLQAIPLLPAVLHTIFWVISLIAALPLLLLSVLTIIDQFGTCTLGANDNKSSVAAMLSIMNKVCPAEDRVDGVFDGSTPSKRRDSDPEPQPAGPVRREVVEEVLGVRHGREILSELNILPASCEIVYETPKVQVVEEYPEDLVTTSVAKSAAVISDESDDDQTMDDQTREEWEDEGSTDEAYAGYSDEEDAEDLGYEEEDDEAWDEDQSFEDEAYESEEDADATGEEDFEDEFGTEEDLDQEVERSDVRRRRLHRVLPLVEGDEGEDEEVSFDEDESYEEDEYEEYGEDDEDDEDEEYEEDDEFDEDSEGLGSSIAARLKGIWAAICAFFVGVVAKIKGLFSKKGEDAEGEWAEDALLEDDDQDSWEGEEASSEDDLSYEEQYEDDYAYFDEQAEDAADEEFAEDEQYGDDYYDESAEAGFEDEVDFEDESDQDAYVEYGDYDEDAYADYDADYELEEQADEQIPYSEEEQSFEQEAQTQSDPVEETSYAYDDEFEEDVIAQGGYEQAPIESESSYDSALEDDYYEDDLYEDDDLYSDDDFAVLEEGYEDDQDAYEGDADSEDASYAQAGEEELLEGAYDEWDTTDGDSIDGVYEGEYEGAYEEYLEEEPAKESIGTKILKAFRRLGGHSQEEEAYADGEYAEDEEYYEGEDALTYESGEYVEEDYAYQDGADAPVEDDGDYDEPYAEDEYAEDEYGYEEIPEGEEYGSYDDDYDQQDYPEQGVNARFADPNELHFDREEDADIVPRDTTGLDTISETYDLIPQEPTTSPRREPPASIDDPNWGVSSYRPTPPAHNIARRAVLFDLPDPSASELDPLAGDEYDDYESDEGERIDNGEGAYRDSYETPYEDEYYDYGDSSLDDIMEQSRDFTDRESARRAATYEDDNRRDNGSRDNQSRSFWKGGAAVRADLRDEDGPIVIDEEDLQDTILEMGDDFLRGHDIWFVATGASSQNHAGIKAFLAEHRRDIRGSFLINLDSIGAGTLSLLVNEGLHAPRRADRRLVRMLKDVAEDLHITLDQAVYNWDETEAATGMRSRIRSVTIVGLDENDLPALSHTQNDVPQNVNPDMVSSVVRLVTEFIRRS